MSKKVKNIIIAISILIMLAALAIFVIIPEVNYSGAKGLEASGDYEAAISAYEFLGDYRDSADRAKELSFRIAEDCLEQGDNILAALYFGKASGHLDARECSFELWNEFSQRKTLDAGYGNTAAVKTDGTVFVVGDNTYGQLDVSDWTDIVEVSVGESHILGLKSDGTVVAAGDNSHGQCDVSQWRDIVSISAEEIHSVGLKCDGTVVSVGGNERGEGDVDKWKDIIAISADSAHTVGLKADGTVVAVGANNYGQCNVSDWKDIMIP